MPLRAHAGQRGPSRAGCRVRNSWAIVFSADTKGSVQKIKRLDVPSTYLLILRLWQHLKTCDFDRFYPVNVAIRCIIGRSWALFEQVAGVCELEQHECGSLQRFAKNRRRITTAATEKKATKMAKLPQRAAFVLF